METIRPASSSSAISKSGAEPPTPSSASPSSPISEALQSLLDWNPPVLEQQEHRADVSTATTFGSRKFYDKHLATDLILKHLQYHPDLAAQIASTVDKAIEAALTDGGTLPPPGGKLMEKADRDDHVGGISTIMSRGMSVIQFYQLATAHLCVPIASTLALHPKIDRWVNLLAWSMAPNAAGFAMAEGSLQILPIYEDDDKKHKNLKAISDIKASMDPDMLKAVHKLRMTYTDLAVWEVKSLTLGDEEVMVGLKRSASAGRPFNWKTCFCDGKSHTLDYMDGVENTRAGPDAPSTPWTLPEIYEDLAQSVDTDADEDNENEVRGDGDDSTSTIGGSPSVTADREYSTASVLTDASDTEGNAETPKDKGKGREDDVGPSNIRNRPGKSPTKRKQDCDYKSLAFVNADNFIQQGWTQAVRTDATIIVLHAGNYEFVCIRHRETQTLYLSDIIHPPTCKAPAYGKLHVGIYIAAVQDAIRRMEYGETLAEDKRSKLPSNFSKFNKKDKDKDGGKDGRGGPADEGRGDPGGRSRGSAKRRKRDGAGAGDTRGRGKSKGGRDGQGGRRTRANLKLEREKQDQTILEANRRDIILVFLRYGIYDSPSPVAFFRKAPAIVRPGQIPTPTPTPKLKKRYAPGTYSTIVITSELGEGSTGKVHGATFMLNDTDHYVDLDVAVKLSFGEEEQERLLHEYLIYCHLNSKGVKGIPTALGLFVDPENGPSALFLTRGGQSIFRRSSEIEYFQREAFQMTLKAIHAAGVLHGDIRAPNLLIDEFGESTIIDFDQAEKDDSENAQMSEFRRLSRILEGKSEY